MPEYIEREVWEDAEDWDIEVTHWMPLPEPPKMDLKGE